MTNFSRRHQAASGAKEGQYVPCTAELQCTLATASHISGIEFVATKQWLSRDGVPITNADVSPEEVERFRRSGDYEQYVRRSGEKASAEASTPKERIAEPVAASQLRKGDVIVFSDGADGYTSNKVVTGIRNDDGYNVRVSYVDETNPEGMVLSTNLWYTTPINRFGKWKNAGKSDSFAPGKPAAEVVGEENAQLIADLADRRARSASNRAGGAATRKAVDDFFGAPVDTLVSRAAKRERQHEALSELMDFGHTISSDGKGNVSDKGYGNSPMVEEIQYVDLDSDGRASEPEAPAGWEYLKGFTNQYGYKGAVLHESEVMGGGLADYILENPGFYATVEIEGMYAFETDDGESSEPVGWGVLHRIDSGK